MTKGIAKDLETYAEILDFLNNPDNAVCNRVVNGATVIIKYDWQKQSYRVTVSSWNPKKSSINQKETESQK
jgi:hypothetical protein